MRPPGKIQGARTSNRRQNSRCSSCCSQSTTTRGVTPGRRSGRVPCVCFLDTVSVALVYITRFSYQVLVRREGGYLRRRGMGGKVENATLWHQQGSRLYISCDATPASAKKNYHNYCGRPALRSSPKTQTPLASLSFLPLLAVRAEIEAGLVS